MKKILVLASIPILSLYTVNLSADTTLYGKAHIAVTATDTDGQESNNELESRASRFGIKGKKDLNDNLQAIYQWETEVKWDGDTVDGDKLQLKSRNTYVGLKGNFGTIKAGIHDTPMKQAEGKIDLFSDREDINNVLKNYLDTQEREKNFLGYYSPKMGQVQFNIATMQGKADGNDLGDAWSSSVVYGDKKLKKSNVYAALAYDSDVDAKDSNAIRFAAATKFDKLKVGLILEQADRSGYEKQNRYVVSGAYKINKNTLLLQHVNAEEALLDDGSLGTRSDKVKQTTVGLDHKLGDNTKIYGTASIYTKGEVDSNKYALGIEHKF